MSITKEQVKKLLEGIYENSSSKKEEEPLLQFSPDDDEKTAIFKTIDRMFYFKGCDEEVKEDHSKNYDALYNELVNNDNYYFIFRMYPAERDVGIMNDYAELEHMKTEQIKQLLKNTILDIFPELKDNQELLNEVTEEVWNNSKNFDNFLNNVIDIAQEEYENQEPDYDYDYDYGY